MSAPVRKPKSIYTHVKFYLIGQQNGEGFHGQLNCVEVIESNYHSHYVYLLSKTNNCNYYY